VRGVRYRTEDGLHEVRAAVTVGATVRFSRVRHLAGFEPIKTSNTLELLQFVCHICPRMRSGHHSLNSNRKRRTGSSPDIGSPCFRSLDQGGHRCAESARPLAVMYFSPPGQYAQVREAGVEPLRQTILDLEPGFAKHLKHLTDFHQINLLSVASSRCRYWHYGAGSD